MQINKIRQDKNRQCESMCNCAKQGTKMDLEIIDLKGIHIKEPIEKKNLQCQVLKNVE